MGQVRTEIMKWKTEVRKPSPQKFWSSNTLERGTQVDSGTESASNARDARDVGSIPRLGKSQVSRYQLATDSWTEVPALVELQPSSSFMCFYNLCVSIAIKSLWFFIVKLCIWYVCVHVLSCFSYVWLFEIEGMVAHQTPLSMEFSRQECWSRLACPLPGNLPDLEIQPVFLMSLALAGGFFTTSALWEAMCLVHMV